MEKQTHKTPSKTKRDILRMAAFNKKKTLLEFQKRDSVVEHHDRNAAKRVIVADSEEYPEPSTRKCFIRPKGYTPEKSAFELAVEKRFNVDVHTGKSLRPEPPEEKKKDGKFRIPKVSGQNINKYRKTTHRQNNDICLDVWQERPVSPARKYPRAMSLTEFAAREERVRIQKIYNPNKDPYRHETIGIDPKKKKTFLEQITEQNRDIDQKCSAKHSENSTTDDITITDEALCSVDFY
jgi:hypothetical protein